METSKFDGMYEYMGFAITNGGSAHEWNIEPLQWDIAAIERFKGEFPIPVLKTLVAAKKWIRSNKDNINEKDFI